jgi:hypothetical protein
VPRSMQLHKERIAASTPECQSGVLVVRRHHLLVRCSHWLNVPILLGLILSGLSIYWTSPVYRHKPDPLTGNFYIVQSRPITTLFPIPEANDQENHVYVSVGYQQMLMTDAMKPLGLSFFRLTAARPMDTAGGRLFVDITQDLASPAKRDIIVNVLGKSNPLIKDALMTILEQGDFIKSLPDDIKEPSSSKSNQGVSPAGFQTLNDYDPQIVSDLIKRSQTSIDELRRDIQTKSGTVLFDFILEDIQKLRKSTFDICDC